MYRILIVEDELMLHRILREIFKPEGFDMIFCSKGQEGLEAARADRPDLIILDINLPDINGMEVCQALKSDPRTKHIPVLMLTGEAREVVSRVQGLDLGAEDYLFKPISGRVLLSRVRSILKLTTKPT